MFLAFNGSSNEKGLLKHQSYVLSKQFELLVLSRIHSDDDDLYVICGRGFLKLTEHPTPY